MATRRLFKFFLTIVAIFFVFGVLAIIGAGVVVMRGPSVPDDSTLILRMGGELVETPPNDVIGQVTGGARAQTVRSYVDALRRAKTDPRIDSVLIVPTHFESPLLGKDSGAARRDPRLPQVGQTHHGVSRVRRRSRVLPRDRRRSHLSAADEQPRSERGRHL